MKAIYSTIYICKNMGFTIQSLCEHKIHRIEGCLLPSTFVKTIHNYEKVN